MPAARLTVWDDSTCWRVHEATLALLGETGVEVRHAGAREQLAEAGASTREERAAARTQDLRDEPRAFAREASIRDRLQAVLAEAEGSSR